jgi:hypothetical protein
MDSVVFQMREMYGSLYHILGCNGFVSQFYTVYLVIIKTEYFLDC